jgi:hypothetical protein
MVNHHFTKAKNLLADSIRPLNTSSAKNRLTLQIDLVYHQSRWFCAVRSLRHAPRSFDLFAAWLTLLDDKRKGMDAEFRNIFEMSCEKGFRAILDEAEWRLRAESEAHAEFVGSLAALANDYERAMVGTTSKESASPADFIPLSGDLYT